MAQEKQQRKQKSGASRPDHTPEPGDSDYIGHPYETDREAVEEGKSREGTNLDLGEERSEEQKREAKKAKGEG